MNLTVKQTSSLVKIRSCGIGAVPAVTRKTLLRGQTFHYQIALETAVDTEFSVRVESPLAEYVSLYANLSPSWSPLCLDKRFVVEPIPILCSVIWFVVNYLTARNTCVSLFVMQDLAPPVKSLSIASVIVE